MTEGILPATEQTIPTSSSTNGAPVDMGYKAAKNLAATQRRDGSNRDAYAVYDVAQKMWTVR